MLEQQHAQLVAGVRELYRRLEGGEEWPGMSLELNHRKYPLTHDILKRLNILDPKDDTSIEHKGFEDVALLKRSCMREDDSQLHQRKGSGEDFEISLVSSEVLDEVSSPAKSTAFIELLSQGSSSRNPFQEGPALQPFEGPSSCEAPDYAMLSISEIEAINSTQLPVQTQYWMDPPQSSLEPMEIDHSSYNLSMSYDPPDASSYPVQTSDATFWTELFADFMQPIEKVKT
jgi:hypothetical protein